MKKFRLVASGIGIGAVNALFGAGGGLIAVPLLKTYGMTQTEAQANSIAVILPLSVVSTLMYLHMDYFRFSEGLMYLPFGIIGAFCGTRLLKITPERILNILFSCLLIYSGARMLFR